MNGTILMTFIILSLIGIAVFFFVAQSRRTNRKRRNELLVVYDSIIVKNNLRITYENKLNNRILGLDIDKNIFVFVYDFGAIVKDIVQLNSSVTCKLKSVGMKIPTRKEKGKTIYEEHISEVYLSLSVNGTAIADVPMYSEIHDGILEKMNLLSLAEDWQQKIRNSVKP